MPHYRRQLGFISLLALAIGSCGDPLSTEDKVNVDFSLRPTQVTAGDSVQAVLVIKNLTGDTVTLYSGSMCVARLTAFLNDTSVFLHGTSFGCLDKITSFPIAPRDSLVRLYQIETRLWDGEPAPAGEYRLRARMEVGLRDQERLLRIVN